MRIPQITLLGLGLALLLFPGLGWTPLFDWDEINFAEISREMWVTGDWLRPRIDFAPFWEKPPLFFWLQALGFSAFGIGEYAARLPNAIAGLLTVAALARYGDRVGGKAFGYWWALFHGLSLLPLVYFRSGIIDPWFNFFILLGLLAWFWAPDEDRRARHALLAGIAAGLAVLTKGPVALLVMGLVMLVRQLTRRAPWLRWWPQVALFTLAAAVVVGAWLLPLWRIDGGWFATEFLRYQWRLLTTPDAGHGGFPGYHLVVLLFGCFPAAAFALPLPWRPAPDPRRADGWLRTLFWVVLILFSVVETKIVHYSSLCYFPLSYFAASATLRAIRNAATPGAWRWKLLTGGFYGLLLWLVPIVGRSAVAWQGYFADYPEVSARLALAVDWPWWTFLPALVFTLGWGAAWWLLAKRSATAQAMIALLTATALSVLLGFCWVAPRIEAYTQGVVREFYAERAGGDAYLLPLGYKTYVHLFYGRRPPEIGRLPETRTVWHRQAPAGLPVLISCPTHRAADLEAALPGARKLFEKGGFSGYSLPAEQPE